MDFIIFLTTFALSINKRMTMYKRTLQDLISQRMGEGKAVIVYGPRQVGKTTVLKLLLEDRNDVLWFNGDEPDVRALFENITSTRLKAIIGQRRLVVIDEAQRISNIGLCMKLITDNLPEVQLIATGSSSFDLANSIQEPLTGRKKEYQMFPLSFQELVEANGWMDERRLLPHRLVYGSYPDVLNHAGEEKETLTELADSYLYKDILSFDRIKKSEKLVKLLQALAYQVGSLVTYNELAGLCGLDAKTVESYVQLLEQAFIIFRLGSYSRNLRNELKFSRKIYFWDCGIRNAVISNFQQLEIRSDTDRGALFENYVIAERMKALRYAKSYAKSYFWRTSAKHEIDYIEEKDGQLAAYEFKWNPKKHPSAPTSFATAYPEASFKVITRENYDEFINH